MTFTQTYRPPAGSGSGSLDGFLSASDYPVDATGATDSRAGLQAAVNAAIAAGSPVLVVAPGTYDLSGVVVVDGARNLRIVGHGAVITYPSDDVSVVAGGGAVSDNEARSAFLLTYCSNVRIEGFKFQGGTGMNTGTNIGVCVYERHCVSTVMRDCHSLDGGSIHQGDATSDTTGVGTSLAFASGTVTLTSSGFKSGHVGRHVTVSNTWSPMNSGVFEILTATPTTITFANLAGSAETSSFSWSIDDHDRGTVIENCTSRRAHNVVTVGNHARITRVLFEQPMTVDLVGTGTGFLKSGSNVSLFDPNATWTQVHVGRYVKVSGSTTPGNDGIFQITAVNAATAFVPGYITYVNASGATESTVRASTKWWIPGGERVGRGAGTGALSHSSGTMTLTASAPSFAASDVGKALHIKAATSFANFGVFQITAFVSSTQVQYSNGGVTEDFSGIWQIDAHDATNGGGTTHAIYMFAGREDIEVTGCTFLGIRRTCVKASGSSAPIKNIRVHHNYARECANFVDWGADDAQRHDDMVVEDNQLIDVATQRVGWSGQIAIGIIGSRGTVVRNNKLHYTRAAISVVDDFHTVAGNYAINAKRYVRGYSQPLEQLTIDGNEVSSDPWVNPSDLVSTAVSVTDAGLTTKWGTTGTFTASAGVVTFTSPGNVLLTSADVGREIRIFGAGDAGNNGAFVITEVTGASTCKYANGSGVNGTLGTGSFGVRDYRTHPAANFHTAKHCRVTNNKVKAVGEIGYRLDACVSLDFAGNTWSDQTVGAWFSNCPMPVIANNREGSKSTLGIYLDDGVAWPTVHDNYSSATTLAPATSYRAGISIIDAAGSICDYPLLGKSGRVRPSGGKAEMVHAYGGLLVDGDIIYVTGTAYTYKASGPSGNQFNSFAGLVALINAQAGLDCADYGTGLSGGDVSTQHMRTRQNAISADADDTNWVLVDALNPTAMPFLSNYVAGNTALVGSRGSGSTGPIADKTVVWTPCSHSSSTVNLIPANTDARSLIATGSFCELRSSMNNGCCAVLQHNETLGSEEMRWTIV